MYVTIYHWIAYGVLLFLNFIQLFWGLWLIRNRKGHPAISTLFSFPFCIILIFGIIMGYGLIVASDTTGFFKEVTFTLANFVFWAFLTAIVFVILLIRYLKK